jgi:excisionase family DNA binding protein
MSYDERTAVYGVTTVSEAAKILGVSARTVRRWFERGTLTGRRTVGNVLLINTSSVRALVRKRQEKTDAAA